MSALSTDDLVRLRDSITPGPWHWRWKTESLHVRHSPPHEFGATVLAPSYDYDTGCSANVREEDAHAIALLPDLLSELIRLRGEVEALVWQPIETAPKDVPVTVKVGDMSFTAVLRLDASLDEHGDTCDQWQAVNEGEHPPCWSGGACWESNEEGMCSMQPTAWRPLPSPPAAPTTGEKP